jgi:hypothetical protein
MSSKDAAKLAALRAVSAELYSEHVRTHGTLSTEGSCWCTPERADDKCDLGAALMRLRWREVVPAGDRELLA